MPPRGATACAGASHWSSPKPTARVPPPATVRCPSATMSDRQDERTHRVTPLELFFDLVFVFAITQVTTFLTRSPTGGGLLRGMLLLAALWWAWGAYAWLTNALDPEEG